MFVYKNEFKVSATKLQIIAWKLLINCSLLNNKKKHQKYFSKFVTHEEPFDHRTPRTPLMSFKDKLYCFPSEIVSLSLKVTTKKVLQASN